VKKGGMARLTEEQLEFLDNPFVGVVTTIRPDGSPHNTVVWVDRDDAEVSFNTATGRAKPRHLEQDPRVALTVVDPQDDHRWLSISGTAELTRVDADPQIDRLAKKYTGADEYPSRTDTEQRLKVRIRPDRVEARGLDG
jgi:PPOX class probable F420-dependent enzyme